MIAGSCQIAGDDKDLAVRKPYGLFVAFDTLLKIARLFSSAVVLASA
jgi:hypothetical protein